MMRATRLSASAGPAAIDATTATAPKMNDNRVGIAGYVVRGMTDRSDEADVRRGMAASWRARALPPRRVQSLLRVYTFSRTGQRRSCATAKVVLSVDWRKGRREQNDREPRTRSGDVRGRGLAMHRL